MANKYYCAVNTKYYKDSNSKGEMGHIQRQMKENKNSIVEYVDRNVRYTFDENNKSIDDYYNEMLEKAKNANKFAFQKNSITYIDSVVVLDNRKFFEHYDNNDFDNVQDALKDYMNVFKDQFGYEPIGFEFHLDEGTEKTADQFNEIENQEERDRYRYDEKRDLYVNFNIHAHCVFLNFDFKNNKTCHRLMNKKKWSKSQDLLHTCFRKLGFDRGEKKLDNKRDHKTKEDYVRELQISQEKGLNEHLEHLKVRDELISEIEEKNDYLQRLESLKPQVEHIKEFFQSDVTKSFVEKVKKSFPQVFEYAKNIYDVITEKRGNTAPKNDDLDELLNATFEEKQRQIERKKEDQIERIEKIKNKRKHSKLKPRP